MEEVELACTSSDETRMESLPELRNQILQLLRARLSDNSIRVMQEELQLMQRSSYYLEIQSDLFQTVEQQNTLSKSTLLILTEQRRLQRAITLANTQVKVLLTFLGLLDKEITKGCLELKTFIVKCNQGSVDSTMTTSVRQRLQQTLEFVKEFESRLRRNLGPLDLQNQLIPDTGTFPIQQPSAVLSIKMPVMFNRLKSHTTSNTVHLSWEVAGKQSDEFNQEFEIHVKSLHPTVAEHDQVSKSTCQSYNIQVTNLIPDRSYIFSVKRADTINLVYGLWSDSITLKTLNMSK